MAILRAIIGTTLLFGGLYFLIGEHFAGTSADATLNASMSVVRTPIEGKVTLAVKSIGALVKAGELLAEVNDERFDTARLVDLEQNRDSRTIELDRIKAQKAAISEAREGLVRQVTEYQRGRISQTQSRIAEAKSNLESSSARLKEADSAFQRAKSLNEKGSETVANLDRLRVTLDVAKQEITRSSQRIAFLETELAAARVGVFIGDSYSDAPASSQKLKELELRVAELTADEKQVIARTKQYEIQIDAERLRVNKQTSATLTAKASSIAWDFLIDDGQFAHRGQDLLKLVDCPSLMVTASVAESLYDKLSIGSAVQFRLFGDERVFNGTITRLGGSGASALYANLAVGPSAKHLERYDVTVSVPGLLEFPDLACAVGRTGRVIFSAGPLTVLRSLASRYGF